MTMEPSGTGRMVFSLIVLAALALAAWLTMEPGKYQQFTWLLLGFFAFRVAFGWQRARRIGDEASLRSRNRSDGQEG